MKFHRNRMAIIIRLNECWLIAVSCLLLWGAIHPIFAQDSDRPDAAGEGKLDSFFIGGGTSNVTHGQDVSLGYHVQGGLELGIWGPLFGGVSYETIVVADSKKVNGQSTKIDLRTTGPALSAGGLFTIRNANIGVRAQYHSLTRYDQRVDSQGTTKSTSGSVDYYSGYVFTRLMRAHELGIRSDTFTSNRVNITGAIGVYYLFHYFF
jgi:hypothetical protein